MGPTTRLSWEAGDGRRRGGRSVGWALAAVLGLAAAGGLAVLLTTSAPRSELPVTAARPAAELPVSPAAAPAAAQETSRAEEVVIDIRGLPAGARVLLDGAQAQRFPLRVRRRDVDAHLRVEAPGYVSDSRLVSLDEDGVVELQMRRIGREPRARRTTDEDQPPAQRGTDPILTDTSEFGSHR